VLEDVELARAAHRSGVACGFFLDGGMLGCRMYESYQSLRRGWKRIFGESANRKPERLRKIAGRVRLVGTILPALSLIGLVIGLTLRHSTHAGAATAAAVICATGLATWLAVVVWSCILGRIPPIWAPAFPAGMWIIGGIMREAADDLEQGRPTEWGGLSIVRDTR
jgi:hypothetical protein